MGKIAFVFSGQGAQYSGMGKQLSVCSKEAKKTFELADRIRPGTSEQCFSGSKEELLQTENTQPCIFCVGFGAAAALNENGIKADCAAGFSAGEVTALAHGGYLSFDQAFRYIIKRAKYMQKSGRKNPGLMFAVLGLNDQKVKDLCGEADGRYPVNFNTATQISVACTSDSAASFVEAISVAGGRTIKLPVSGGFHSPMMRSARAELEKEFESIPFKDGKIPVYANVSAEIYKDKNEMFRQINSPVLWYQTILNMKKNGVETFVELGPGKTLKNMITKIDPDALVLNVEDKKSLENTVEVLKDVKE